MIIEKKQKFCPEVVLFILEKWISRIEFKNIISSACGFLDKESVGTIKFAIFIREDDKPFSQMESLFHEIFHIYTILSNRKVKEADVEKRACIFVRDNLNFCLETFAKYCGSKTASESMATTFASYSCSKR